MIVVTRILMFVACLMYGMMPGMAADMLMPMSGSQVSERPGDHAGHASGQALDDTKNQSNPCPHKSSITHAPFCAACLVLLPDLIFTAKGTSPRAAPLPRVEVALIGNQLAPPLPPPRV